MNRRLVLTLVILFLVVLATRVAYVNLVFTEEAFTKWMPYQFDMRALAMLFGEKVFFVTGWASYPVFLAVFYGVLDFFGLLDQRFYLVALANSALAALCICLVYLIARELFGRENKVLVWLLTFLYATYYPALYFTLLNVSENLFSPLILALFYLALKTETPTWRRGLAAGILFGWAVVLRPILLPFLPFYAGWFWVRFAVQRGTFLKAYAPVFAVSMAAVVLVVCAINSRFDRNGIFHFTGNGGANIAIAWCKPQYIGYTHGERQWFSHPTVQNTWNLIDIETTVPFYEQGYYYRMGLKCMREQPFRWITNVEHIAALFDGILYPDYLLYKWHHDLFTLWKIYTIPLMLGFFLFPWAYRGEQKGWGLAAGLFASLILSMYLASSGEERYLVPYYFVLIVWGMAGLLKAIYRLLALPRARLMMVLSLLGLAGVIGYWLYQTAQESFERWEISRAYHGTALWLANNQREDGRFIYEIRIHNPVGRFKGEGMVRQLLASYGLAQTVRHFDDPALEQAHKQNLGFIESKLVDEGEFAYIGKEPGTRAPTVNAAAFATLALLETPKTAMYEEHIRKLGEFILKMQQPDGRFHLLYPTQLDATLGEDQVYEAERFAAGEATLACVRLYGRLRDPRYLACARRSFNYYYPLLESRPFDPPYASWNLLAYLELEEVKQDPRYREAIFKLADHYVAIQNRYEDREYLLGGFDVQGGMQTSSEAVYTEGLGRAYRLAKKTGDAKRARIYREANRLGLKNLLRFHYGMHHRTELAGGIRSAESVATIRVDNNGHALSAFYEYFTREEP